MVLFQLAAATGSNLPEIQPSRVGKTVAPSQFPKLNPVATAPGSAFADPQ